MKLRNDEASVAGRLFGKSGWYRRVRAQYRNLSVFQKMITANFLILALFSLAIFAVVQYAIASYNEQIYKKTVQVLGEFTTGVYQDLQKVEQCSLNTAMNLQVQTQLVKLLNAPDDYDEFQSTAMLENQLLLQSISTQYLTTVCYVDTKGKSFTLGANAEPLDDDTVQMLCSRAADAKGGYIHLDPSLSRPYVYSSRQILEYLNTSLQPLGTLLFASDLGEIIRENYKALPDEHAILMIYDKDQLIYENSPGIRLSRPPTHPQGYYMENIRGQTRFIAYIHSDELNWTYVSVLPYSSMFRNVIRLKNILLILLPLLFFISALLIFRVSRHITRPLEDLAASMHLAETGDFQNLKEDLFDYDRSDEIGCLQNDFLKMFRKINRLIEENYRKQLTIQDTKYRALQAQMEPHFLYNTLSSVNWLAMAGKDAEVSQVVIALSSLLRAAIHQKPAVLLGEEVRLLEYYMDIQKIRFEDRIAFHIQIEPAHRLYIVPCMFLQPIVENSIKYGMDHMLETCVIGVRSEDAGEDIRIIVEDNGPGIPADRLEKLRRLEVVPMGSGIGLRNIDERLHILFSGHYRLQIDSQVGKGTRVTIQIPKKGEISIAENIAGG